MSWTLIEHQALTSSVASVTLGSGGTIPQTYKTLKLVVSTRGANAGFGSIKVAPNGASTNLTSRYLFGNGSSASSGSSASLIMSVGVPGSTSTSNTFANGAIDFPNYTSTTTNKPVSADNVSENNATESYQSFSAGLWSSTSAITSIVLSADVGDFVSGSTFTLYGLA